jgi:hypothetical protein
MMMIRQAEFQIRAIAVQDQVHAPFGCAKRTLYPYNLLAIPLLPMNFSIVWTGIAFLFWSGRLGIWDTSEICGTEGWGKFGILFPQIEGLSIGLVLVQDELISMSEPYIVAW